MKKQFLAISHSYEKITDEKGNFIGQIHVFDKKAERDEFVDNGATIYSAKGYRETIKRREALKTQHEQFWQRTFNL